MLLSWYDKSIGALFHGNKIVPIYNWLDPAGSSLILGATEVDTYVIGQPACYRHNTCALAEFVSLTLDSARCNLITRRRKLECRCPRMKYVNEFIAAAGAGHLFVLQKWIRFLAGRFDLFAVIDWIDYVVARKKPSQDVARMAIDRYVTSPICNP